MKLPKTVLALVAGLTLTSAAAPASTVTLDPPLLIQAGTTSWYQDASHQVLVGYTIVECDGTRHGPYPGPGRPFAEITDYEVFTPQPC